MATPYVKEDYRNKGVGKKLQEISIEYAKQKDYSNLYLITEHDNYYEKTGWEAPLDNGKYEKIYKYDLKH